MTTIVAISDLHLDVRTGGVRRFDEIARALRQAKDEAIRRKADLFVVGGDLGDPDSGSIVYKLLALCVEVMGELSRAGVKQVWVKGNHDGESGESLFTPIASLGGSTNVVPNVPILYSCFVMESPMFWRWTTSPFDCLALPHSKYDPVKVVRDYAEWRMRDRETCGGEYPLGIVVSHLFPIQGLEPGEESSEMPRGGPVPLPCETLSEVPGPLLILSGHYHRRQIYQPPVKGCPPVHVIGSACQLSHSEESNNPGFLCVEF